MLQFDYKSELLLRYHEKETGKAKEFVRRNQILY